MPLSYPTLLNPSSTSFPPSLFFSSSKYINKKDKDEGCIDPNPKEHIEEWKGRGSKLSFFNKASSDKAEKMIAALSDLARLKAGKANRPSKQFVSAIEAFVADLLYIAGDDDLSYGYHGMSPANFKSLRVGYKPFVMVTDGLEALGMIDKRRGLKPVTGQKERARQTQFRATDLLLAYAADYDVDPENVTGHFEFASRPASVDAPITLKTKRTFGRDPKLMYIDPNDADAQRLGKEVNELNAFFQKQSIEPNCHYAFVRKFSNGDQEGDKYKEGGRLYSIGLGNYQQLPSKRGDGVPVIRADIRLNGETTVELDIKASHPTILHAKAGLPLPNHPDPYIVAGFDRPVIKTFMTMTLGYDKFHKDWSDGAARTYNKKSKKHKGDIGLDLRAHSFESVKKAVLNAMPLLNDWPSSPVRWGSLQYIESEVIIGVVRELALVHGVPALPVHDSIIVPRSRAALATRILSEHFERNIGVIPTIEAK